jgi:hypothetical protein
VEILSGCDAVICGGIGSGAWDLLTAQSIQPTVLAGAISIEEAISGYLDWQPRHDARSRLPLPLDSSFKNLRIRLSE